VASEERAAAEEERRRSSGGGVGDAAGAPPQPPPPPPHQPLIQAAQPQEVHQVLLAAPPPPPQPQPLPLPPSLTLPGWEGKLFSLPPATAGQHSSSCRAASGSPGAWEATPPGASGAGGRQQARTAAGHTPFPRFGAQPPPPLLLPEAPPPLPQHQPLPLVPLPQQAQQQLLESPPPPPPHQPLMIQAPPQAQQQAQQQLQLAAPQAPAAGPPHEYRARSAAIAFLRDLKGVAFDEGALPLHVYQQQQAVP
jgi:hypothetical protein